MAAPDELQRRRLDALAVQRGLRRLAQAAQPPWLHAEVARRMAQRLDIVRLQPRCIVDWWSHLGASAELLAARYPAARRWAVEPDAAFATRSRQHRSPWWSLQRWRAGAATVLLEDGTLPDGIELIWSNMMVHQVADAPALFERWQRALAVDGFVMFSCLGPGTAPELRALYQREGWGAPTQGFIDMHDLGDMLAHAGFADPVMDQETLTLRWNDAPALLAELRSLGGNTDPQRFAGLRTPHWRKRLLDGLRPADGATSMAFEIVYGHAFKASPRVRAEPTATVSLDALRAELPSSRGAR